MADKLKITRKKLYDEILNEAPTKVAARYDISYQKLKSVCDEYNIPIPPQSYYRDKRNGEDVAAPILPDSEVETIEIDTIEHRENKTTAQLTNKANTLCILQILRDYSDRDRILTTSEIIEKMASLYGLHITRRTVYSCMAILIDMGFDVSLYEDNGKGYYLDSRELEQSEIRLLMDCVYSNTAISARQSEQLIEKLQNFLPEYKRRHYKHLSIVGTKRKTPNKEVFLNIELLDEAITKKKKVEFEYTNYNLKKELVARRSKPYKVSPYAMVASNDGYYLFCRSGWYDNISIYRIDKIRKIRITDEKAEQKPEGFETAKYTDESVLMYSSERVEARLKCDNIMLGDVIDKFGGEVKLFDNNDGETFTAVVKGAFDGLKIWAVHYLDACEIIAPQELRGAVVEMIKKNKYGELNGSNYEKA